MQPQFDKVQYDRLGATYDGCKNLQYSDFELASIKAHIGNVSGLRVLDLACGTGYWSRTLLRWGAKEVVGVDISSKMVDEARRQSSEEGHRLQFHVADCSKPLDSLGLGRFDRIIGVWMVNYLGTVEELSTFWENIANSLKPGGRWIGTLPNHKCLVQGFHIINPRFGVSFEGLGRIENGVRFQATVLTENPFTIQSYLIEPEVIERCAAKAGVSLQWMPLVDPNDPELDFEEFSRMPHFEVFTGTLSGPAADA